MRTQANKLGNGSRKRAEKPICVDSSPGVQILSMRAIPSIAFKDEVPRLNKYSEKRAVDVVFRALLAKANQELATLLRDVQKGPQAGLHWSAYSRQISELLTRAVRCAAKQYMLQAELGILALKDELTGFYNRRGFQALAERQLKLGRRSGRGLLLFFIDVDGLKQVNDSLGHTTGDRALKLTAEALKKTFRDSDVIARLGGDEFAVLAIEASGHSEATITARLHRYLHAINAGEAQCKISLSVGVARFDHRNPTSIAELMAQADQAMYEHKRTQRNLQTVAVETGSPC
jgi:diguanylate cyclase (GGDEF)-like protein